MRRRMCLMAVPIAMAVGGWLAAAGPSASAKTPRERLVRDYSPILMLRAQDDGVCDNSEEQYRPTKVEVVLGNPDVRLVPPPGSPEEAERAPTAADIGTLGKGYYLDLPGDPLDPGCRYAKDFAKLEKDGRAPAVTYAHLRRQPGQRGLYLQYFFYYYFNQFNDVHESDWEGLQIAFDVNGTRRALAQGPSEIGLFQHSGGEKADWTDEKVQKDGTHPIVYPAAGSHATFYDSAIYVENGRRGSGLGCDNTSEPLTEVRPKPILVPTQPAPGSRYEWLSFTGRWGEKEKSFNNGPTGPNTKPQWREPVRKLDDLRSSSPRLPGGALLGPAVTTAFCPVVAEISSFINFRARTPVEAMALLVGLILLIVVLAALTRWRPVELTPLRQQRAFGQLVRAARQLYGRHWRPLVLIGLSSVPIVGALAGLHWLVEEALGSLPGAIGSLSFQLGEEGAVAPLAGIIGGAVVSGAVVTFARELDLGQPVGFLASYRLLVPCFWRLAFSQLVVNLFALLLVFTVIGIPIAIWKYVEWQFVQQEIVFKDSGLLDAFRGSSRLVRGSWWHTARVVTFLWLLSIIAGPILGFALIFADLSLVAINLIGSIVFALLIPYVTLGRTLLYFDLAARPQELPARASLWSRLVPRRTRPTA